MWFSIDLFKVNSHPRECQYRDTHLKNKVEVKQFKLSLLIVIVWFKKIWNRSRISVRHAQVPSRLPQVNNKVAKSRPQAIVSLKRPTLKLFSPAQRSTSTGRINRPPNKEGGCSGAVVAGGPANLGWPRPQAPWHRAHRAPGLRWWVAWLGCTRVLPPPRGPGAP